MRGGPERFGARPTIAWLGGPEHFETWGKISRGPKVGLLAASPRLSTGEGEGQHFTAGAKSAMANEWAWWLRKARRLRGPQISRAKDTMSSDPQVRLMPT